MKGEAKDSAMTKGKEDTKEVIKEERRGRSFITSSRIRGHRRALREADPLEDGKDPLFSLQRSVRSRKKREKGGHP